MTGKNVLITAGVILVGAAVVGANLWFQQEPALTVSTEAIRAGISRRSCRRPARSSPSGS